MRIRHLSVRNFRGIRALDWPVPDRSAICLIGRGDSTKSTILEALRRAFHPHWNLSFDDADFYLCDTAKSITIEAILGNLPDAFRDLENYGYLLCGWNAVSLSRTDDPGDGLEEALRIRLTVAGDLEPTWAVIKRDADHGKPFKVHDRAKVAVSLVGSGFDRHLTWSRGSILSQLTETENVTHSLADATRAAKAALDHRRADSLTEFDAVAKAAQTTAVALGVNVASSYKAHLDSGAVNVRAGGLALHDGEMPLRQLGLGSKRMLTTGLRIRTLGNSHITLFDEVELGLEPHRIARLLQHLKQDNTGQYFLATHSPVVLRELTIADLHIVHCDCGDVDVVAADQPPIADGIQGKIRASAEAFLAPKIVVCEGATEIGFLRGLDDHWIASENKHSFAYCGVALLDANGATKIKEIAETLKTLGYSVAVLADSDSPSQFSDDHAEDLRNKGITVAKWNDGLSIEERVFNDLSWVGAMSSLKAACDSTGDQRRILAQVQTQFSQRLHHDYSMWSDSWELRTALGAAAKTSGWFKRQSLARQWAAAVSPHLDDDDIRDSDLVQQITILRSWIDDDE